MDNYKTNRWKVIIKNVVNHFRNKPTQCGITSPFKMSSHLKDPTIASQINHNHIQELNLDEKINAYKKIMNKNRTEVEQLNNQTSISDYLNDNTDTENGTKGSRLTLQDNPFIQNDLYKDCSQETKNSTDSLCLTDIRHDNTKHKQPVMGKTALLKKTNLEHSDSFIVHSIILNKYEDVLNHYVNRMYRRRLSRRSNSEDEYSENCTLPRYSPSSVSSVETPGSISDSHKNYFGNEKKFYSVDELNVDGQKEYLNDSSMTCYSYFNNGISTSCSEYDPKIFLANAIGDLTTLESGCQNRTADTTETCETSVGTSHISSLISKSNSFCSSLKRNLKRKNSKKSIAESAKNIVLTTDELLEQYKKELSRQNSIIFQISKALNFCKNSKDFFIGRERLEAEKILLVATITKEALKTEINTIEFDTYRNIYDPRCTGNIEISELAFKLKDTTHRDRLADNEEHFLMVLTCGKNVLSTEILRENDGVVKSEKKFKFRSLTTDFEISLFVYSLVMSKMDYNSQDQVKKCPSPKSIFKCNTHSRQYRSSYKFKASEQIAFVPIGRCHVRNSEISCIKNGNLNLKLEQDPERSSLQQEFDMRIETSFQLTNRLPGFLTIGVDNDKNCLTWNRRWCILDGFLLKYWNYPSDEASEPLGEIDVRLTAAEKIVPADRTVCARPRTLALPVSDADGGVKKYFLSADTQSDLLMWESELNFVVQSLMIWRGSKRC
ncbi:unnamed protein product [Psylliodes chrysocephalus]|uniref:PH domain-containing protein n=1 Tax=Psylliodes chrysocephalus TaxID=3402493 RepID=A0A9P0CZG6_9CUCU|nr:unnamed protein product [Psylliodes chrysocephala]